MRLSLALALTATPLFAQGCHRAALERAEEAFSEGRMEQAIALAGPWVEGHPDQARGQLLLGRAHAASRRCDEAVEHLASAVTLDTDQGWVRAWALVELGKCQYILDERAAARTSLALAVDADATTNSKREAREALATLGLLGSYDAWPTIRTEHISFHFSPGFPADAPHEDYAAGRERAWLALADTFGEAPDGRIDFYFWGSDDEAGAVLGRKLGFAMPTENVVHSRWNQTRGHELTHVFVGRLYQPSPATSLINEGIAVYMDLSGRDRMEVARRAVSESQPFHIVAEWSRREEPAHPALYPVGGVLVERLVELAGWGPMRELLRDQRYAHALEIYGPGLETWIAELEAELNRPPGS